MASDIPRSWLREHVVQLVLSTSTIIGLIIYFGLIYTIKLYDEFGVSLGQLGYGTTDYVFLGLNTVLLLIGLPILVTSVGLLLGHLGMVWLELRRPTASKWSLVLLFLVGVVTVALYWPNLALIGESSEAVRWLFGGSVGGYAIVRLVRTGRLSALLRGWDIESVGASKALAVAVVSVLVVALFAVMQLLANDAAFEEACRVEFRAAEFSMVTIYSRHPLGIPTGVGDTSGTLVWTNKAVRDDGTYQYDGYRLLVKTPDALLIWRRTESPRSGVLVVPDAEFIVEVQAQRPAARDTTYEGQDDACVEALGLSKAEA